MNDVETARAHHAVHGDMDGHTCLLNRCALHYPEKKRTGHAPSCPAYGNYQPPYEECTCGAEGPTTNIVRTLGEEGRIIP